MLGQAASMLVDLAACLAADFDTVALLAIFGEVLTIAGSADPGLVRTEAALFGGHLGRVVDGAFRVLVDELVRRKTSRRRKRAAGQVGLAETGLGHPARGTRNWE